MIIPNPPNPPTIADDSPLADEDRFTEPYKRPTILTTLWSLFIWGPAAIAILFWYALFWLLHITRIVPGGRLFKLARWGARSVMRMSLVFVRRIGDDCLVDGGPYIFVPNHVSMFDAPVLSESIPVYTRAAHAIGHLKLPVYGGFVKMMDEVLIDFKDPEQRRLADLDMKARLDRGQSILMFPEGQRSFDGKLGTFYDGAFRLAIETGYPVVTISVLGLRNICHAGEWRVRPGRVTVVFGSPIETHSMTAEDVSTLRNRCRRQIDGHLRWAHCNSQSH